MFCGCECLECQNPHNIKYREDDEDEEEDDNGADGDEIGDDGH